MSSRREFDKWTINTWCVCVYALCSSIFYCDFSLEKINKQFSIYASNPRAEKIITRKRFAVFVRCEEDRRQQISKKFANTKCKMLNNGSSESDDSEIEAICRRTRGHDKSAAIGLETEKKNAIDDTSDSSKTTDDSGKMEEGSSEDENEMVLVPTGEGFAISSYFFLVGIDLQG